MRSHILHAFGHNAQNFLRIDLSIQRAVTNEQLKEQVDAGIALRAMNTANNKTSWAKAKMKKPILNLRFLV
jgi:hypothetical protein